MAPLKRRERQAAGFIHGLYTALGYLILTAGIIYAIIEYVPR